MQPQPRSDIEKYSGKFAILVADRVVTAESIVESLTVDNMSVPVSEMEVSFAGPFSNPVTVVVTLQKLNDRFAILSVPDIVGVCDTAAPGIMAVQPLDPTFLPTANSQPLQFVQAFEEPLLFGATQVRIDETGLIIVVSPFFAFPGLGGLGGVRAFTYLYPLH